MSGRRSHARPEVAEVAELAATKPLYGPIRMNKGSDSGRVAGDDVAS